MKIVIIGTGNVATVFGRLFRRAGFQILQVLGRDTGRTAELASELGCNACTDWKQASMAADLYLAAISDTALYDLHEHLRLSGQLILHTAGSVPQHVLHKVSINHGILYPLQSLRKEIMVLNEIPLLVSGNNEFSKRVAHEIASRLSSNVSFTNDEGRLKLHVAAVFINNFTNHLYALTEEFCQKEKLDFKLLLPLALETVTRLKTVSAGEVLTGPAIRKDEITINKHLELLSSYPAYQEMYRFMTESIVANTNRQER